MMCLKTIGCGTNRAWLKTLVILDLISNILAAVGLIALSVVIWAPATGDVLKDVFQTSDSSSRIFASIGVPLCALWCAVNCHFYCMVLRAERSTLVAHGLWKSWSNFVKICMGGKIAMAILGVCAAVAFDVNVGTRIVTVQMSVTLLLTLIHDGYLLLLTKNRYQEKVVEEAEAKDKYSQYKDC